MDDGGLGLDDMRGVLEFMPGMSPEELSESFGEFLDNYLGANRPVIVTDAMANWPVLAQWSPAYFRDRFGDERDRTRPESPGPRICVRAWFRLRFAATGFQNEDAARDDRYSANSRRSIDFRRDNGAGEGVA